MILSGHSLLQPIGPPLLPSFLSFFLPIIQAFFPPLPVFRILFSFDGKVVPEDDVQGMAGWPAGSARRRVYLAAVGLNSCPLFTFRQMAVSSTEFQALPGPEVRPLCAKTIRHGSFLGPGGQALLFPRTGLFGCRGARPGARSAHLVLRKNDWTSALNSFPADAFCA